jgi:6-phosphogluconolactonase
MAVFAAEAVDRKGMFTLAVSGGRTPWRMFENLREQAFPWRNTVIFQVDERIAPDGDEARNLSDLQLCLSGMPATIIPMPVTQLDLPQAARDYGLALPDTLDLVHLGLGDDGHTASLIPGDPVVDCVDERVALTSYSYQGHRRMTMTLPTIDAANNVMWVITGAQKAAALKKLLAADPSIPAGRVKSDQMLLVADIAALA